MLSNSYHKSKFDSCLHHEGINSGGSMYLLLYVEDILTVGKSSRDIEKLKN